MVTEFHLAFYFLVIQMSRYLVGMCAQQRLGSVWIESLMGALLVAKGSLSLQTEN